MIFLIKKNQLSGKSLYFFLRQCGFQPHQDGNSFIRKLSTFDFPRFHLYIKNNKNGDYILKLHLDMKKPTYKLSPAHSGEYNGEIIEEEKRRILNQLYNKI